MPEDWHLTPDDPYHAGKMAAAYIRGIQSQGIAACPKHFAANSQELRRMANDSVVDERTFRELYTTGFEIAVKEGKAKSIMSSFFRRTTLSSATFLAIWKCQEQENQGYMIS